MYGYVRICTVVPPVTVADPFSNLNSIIHKLSECQAKGANIVVLPELSLTGYSCADLFGQKALINASTKCLSRLVRSSRDYPFTFVFGAPIHIMGQLYDCAIVVACGRVCGIVPKTRLNIDQQRWFSQQQYDETMFVNSSDIGISDIYEIPFGSRLIFNINGDVKFGVVIGDDSASPLPLSTELSLKGAQIILSLSADKGLASAYDKRIEAVKFVSRSAKCAYAYVSAGADESTSDSVYCGCSMLVENGELLCDNGNTVDSDYILCADIDMDIIDCNRHKDNAFNTLFAAENHSDTVNILSDVLSSFSDGCLRCIDKYPFIPSDKTLLIKRCKEIFDLQVSGLKKRLSVTGCRPVIGVSGGLDSTLALLVCVQAAKQLGRSASDVVGITMPCFGTSDRTYSNSVELMRLLGISYKEISIKESCLQHFNDIQHDPNVHDTTYENSQARERTQVLMDYAGSVGGLVVGTGDLSELALGWCTYNGDHMSMYGVNADIPKTLISRIIDYLADTEVFNDCADILRDIINTPISPELLPPDADGVIAQQTEDIVGPYSLHDFFLYYTVRYGFAPKKLFALATRAFADEFDDQFIIKWLKVFYRRFFSQQFKRNCMPDGVKIGSISLSSKGDWSMPSDAGAALWLREVDEL